MASRVSVVSIAGNGVYLSVRGLDEAKAALDAMSGTLRYRTIGNALFAAAVPIVLYAQSVAPVLKFATRRRVPGTLKRNIRIFKSKKATGKNGVLGVYVSVRASKADLKKSPISGDPYYFRWVEGGHRIVHRFKGKYMDFKQRGRGRLTGLVNRRRASTGVVPPHAFLLPAYRVKGPAAVRIFTDKVLAQVDKTNQGKK